jgi:hypothetical protein
MGIVIATLSVSGLAVEMAFHGLRTPSRVRQPTL